MVYRQAALRRRNADRHRNSCARFRLVSDGNPAAHFGYGCGFSEFFGTWSRNWVDNSLAPSDDADSFELQMQNFGDAIRGVAAPINTAQQAVYLMEMLDAIYLSSSSRSEVPIARA